MVSYKYYVLTLASANGYVYAVSSLLGALLVNAQYCEKWNNVIVIFRDYILAVYGKSFVVRGLLLASTDAQLDCYKCVMSRLVT